MFFGVPTGSQNIHVDIDLSDIGILSQTPRDMIYKGYGLKQFDSPNKFKSSTNLDSLPQIITQDTSIFVYPFWGDETQGEVAISKKTINIQYKFEPTCVFMGSIFTDSVKSGVNKTCRPSTTSGIMSEMMSSEGSIEMIRESIDGKIEHYDINGTRLINSDGVWCYQIPMNLDYVITDEYGNLVPTTDPTKGIPTRSNVRFRITLDDAGDEYNQNKTGAYLIPNKPNTTNEEDYEFNSNCKPTSFVNLFWNKVYSVKNYIPRVGKSAFLTNIGTDRHFTGLKAINYHQTNNPAPYNNIWININLRFMLICLLSTFLIKTIGFINRYVINFLNNIAPVAYIIIDKTFIGDCSLVSSDIEYIVPIETNNNSSDPWIYNQLVTIIAAYNLKNGTGYVAGNNSETKIENTATPAKVSISPNKNGTGWVDITNSVSILFENKTNNLTKNVISCIETQLSAENSVVNFDFYNDWINGSLYSPRFLTKTSKNKKTGKLDSIYCGSWNRDYINLHLVQACTTPINKDGIVSGNNSKCDSGKCYQQNDMTDLHRGIMSKNTVDNILYYRSLEFPNKYLHPTEVILLGSLVDCDQDGIPKLHQLLPTTSFKLPPESFEPDLDNYPNEQFSDSTDYTKKEMSGIDWGNKDEDGNFNLENGLFVAVGCLDSTTIPKTCINATRLCEIGVNFDEKYTGSTSNGFDTVSYIDGYISTKEISDGDSRAMFSTLNGNNLSVKSDKYNKLKYDFTYNYPEGFDGKLRAVGLTDLITGDTLINDYYNFRFGLNNNNIGYDYNGGYAFPRYENSFYFYFGLKPGNTALDLFNTQYFVPCSNIEKDKFVMNMEIIAKESICFGDDGIIKLTLNKEVLPYSVYVDNILNSSNNYSDSLNITGLTSKYYNIKITDGNNNSVTRSIFVPRTTGVMYDVSFNNASSYYNNDGGINLKNINSETVHMSGFNYLVENTTNLITKSGTTTSDNIDLTGLTIGNYNISVSVLGCSNDYNNKSLVLSSPPPVTTLSGSTVTGSTAIISGRATYPGIISRGFYVTTDPTFVDQGEKYVSSLSNPIFTSNILDLSYNTTYYFRAYATNIIGIGYGDIYSFSTEPIPLATVTTAGVTAITESSAQGGGTVVSSGDVVSSRGICWSTSINPTTTDNITVDGSGIGSFTSNLTGLLPGTNYHVRAYAINPKGTGYGNDVEFTTYVSVTTYSALRTESHPEYATCIGSIEATSGVSEVGFAYGTTPTPSIGSDSHIIGTLTGNTINGVISGLTIMPIGSYYIRAYATNSHGTTYGNDINDSSTAPLN